MDILKSGRSAMRHAASEGSTGLDWDWLPDKKSGKTIAGLSALAAAAACSTAYISTNLAEQGKKDPTPVIDGTDNLPQRCQVTLLTLVSINLQIKKWSTELSTILLAKYGKD